MINIYYPLDEMFGFIDERYRQNCWNIYVDNKKLFEAVQGSINNHQNWPGGYYDHIQEVMNIGIVLYLSLDNLRKLSFSLSDVLLILFLHDLEKLWKYQIKEDGQLYHIPELETKIQAHQFRLKKLKEYNIILNDEQLNALKYVEGELSDYSSRERIMNPLAALCHLADTTSARIWYGYPVNIGDSWNKFGRIKK